MAEKNDKKPSLREDPTIKRVRDGMRITKVVCTRSVKGRNGDHYVGFSAAWDSTQDDAGGGGTLMSTMPDTEVVIGQSQTGLTMKDAKVASLLLGMQADLAAYDNAWASHDVTAEQRDTAHKGIKSNYGKMLMELLYPSEPSGS